MNAHKQHRCHSVPAEKETMFAMRCFLFDTVVGILTRVISNDATCVNWLKRPTRVLTCGEAFGVCPTSPKLDLQERFAVLLFVLICVELKSIIVMFIYIIISYMIVQCYFAL